MAIFLPQTGQCQGAAEETNLLHKLDSLSKAASVSSYFAATYLSTMINARRFFEKAGPDTKQHIRRMESSFADHFFRSAQAYANKEPVPETWKAYYADTTASPVRHLLLGINSHLHGDIWQSLAATFSPEELKAIRPSYLSYYSSLLLIYDQVYAQAISNSFSLKLIHSASFGLDKWYGEKLLHRWLKRQLELAGLYYSDPNRFRKKLNRLHRKMGRLNNLITAFFY